jgi:hypothetical protein
MTPFIAKPDPDDDAPEAQPAAAKPAPHAQAQLSEKHGLRVNTPNRPGDE